MPASNLSAGAWPSAQQTILLRAALCSTEEAGQAWRAWSECVRFEDIDTASMALLSLVDRNLGETCDPQGVLGRVRGVSRRVWYTNQRLLESVRPVLGALEAANLEPILIGGGALALSVYEDFASRPLEQIDVLVRPCAAGQAYATLVSAGFLARHRFDPAGLQLRNAVDFARESESAEGPARVRLHRALLPDIRDHEFDQKLRTRLGSVSSRDENFRALDPTDELLLALGYGATWRSVCPLLWVADAYRLIQSSRCQISWTRLIENAHRFQLLSPLQAAVVLLTQSLRAEIPAPVCQEFARLRPGSLDRLNYAARCSKLTSQSMGNIPNYLLQWQRRSRVRKYPTQRTPT